MRNYGVESVAEVITRLAAEFENRSPAGTDAPEFIILGSRAATMLNKDLGVPASAKIKTYQDMKVFQLNSLDLENCDTIMVGNLVGGA